MLKLSIAGIFIGVILGAFILFVWLTLSKSMPSFQTSKLKKILPVLAIVLALVTSGVCGVAMGYYVKVGALPGVTCEYPDCKKDAFAKFHCSFSGNQYYCATHYTYAVETYEALSTIVSASDPVYIGPVSNGSAASVSCRKCGTGYRANTGKGQFIQTHNGLCTKCYD